MKGANMKKALKTISIAAAVVFMLNTSAFADFREHFDLGQNYLAQYQYSGAINEFRSALRINYMDTSARIGLVNSYLARGMEYANKDKSWEKAANDYRSALFYLKYYPGEEAVRNSSQVISQVTNNLSVCLDVLKYDKNFQNRYETAKQLRAEGNFPAAAYEFNQALGSKNLQKDSFKQIGDIMNLLGNKPKAAEYYKKAVAVAPQDLDLRLTYANSLDANGNEDGAITEYSYVLDRSNINDKDILYTLERTFKKKLEDKSKDANLNADMGAVLQKEGRLDEALSYYKQAETLDPSNINTRINVGTLYQQKEDYRTAIKAYETVLILYPDNVRALLYRAQCYDKLGDKKIADEGYKKVLTLDPDNQEIKAQMLANIKKDSTPEAFVQYVKANFAQNNPENIIYDYALELHRNGNTDNAIAMYKEAINLANTNADAEMYVNLALAQAQRKDFDSALLTLNTANSKFLNNNSIKETIKNIQSMQTDTKLTKAAEFYKNQDYKNAITAYLDITPPTSDTMLAVAGAYQELGDKINAIEYYKKALSLKPVDSNIAFYIASLYGEQENYASAKDYLKKAIAFDKNNSQAIEYLKSIEEMEDSNLLNEAINKYEANNLDDSLKDFNSILSKDTENAYALYYRGMIYDTKGKKQESINDLIKAYKLNKDFTICNYIIASNYDSLEKYKEAYNYYLAYANSDVPDDDYKKYAQARAEELKKYAEDKTATK